MRVLSLFDGISCGMVALKRAGIDVERYVSYEIDKYAIQVSESNWPEIEQRGDVTKADFHEFSGFDLLIGGSPCQGFSVAGKGLNFSDPRSKLFFEYVRELKEAKPKWFLLENVKMRKEWQDIITSILGVEPIEINSSLVSAQSRRRLYWTNIPGVKQPEDSEIKLNDILLNGIGCTVIDCGKRIKSIDDAKSNCLLARDGAGFNNYGMTGVIENGKHMRGGVMVYSVKNGVANVQYNSRDGVKSCECETELPDGDYTVRKLDPVESERLQTLPDGYTRVVSTTRRHQCLGNSWTADVIAHIFKNIPKQKRQDDAFLQMSLFNEIY